MYRRSLTNPHFISPMHGKIVAIITVIIVIAGGWYLVQKFAEPAPEAVTDHAPTTAPAANTAASAGTTVTYSNQGFLPKNISVPAGTTVTFINQSSNEMWIASNPHPTHQGYDGTTRSQHCAAGYNGAAPFDECAAGTSFSFTFMKPGTWGYHNHGNPADNGTVTVTAAAMPTPM